MSEQIMVIASNIRFSDTLTSEQVDNFPNISFGVEEDGLYPLMYEWYRRNQFDVDLDEMYEYCKRDKIKPKGSLFAVIRESEDNDVQQVCVKLDAKGYEYIEGTFCITMKKEGTKKKTLKLEEKLELFREFWNRNRRIPNPSEIYKDFKIGSFYKTCIKNAEAMESLNEITNDK